MGTNEYSQPASKSSWDRQDLGDVNMVLKLARFHKSSRSQWVNLGQLCQIYVELSLSLISKIISNDIKTHKQTYIWKYADVFLLLNVEKYFDNHMIIRWMYL